jgi:hypothetical protein
MLVVARYFAKEGKGAMNGGSWVVAAGPLAGE